MISAPSFTQTLALQRRQNHISEQTVHQVHPLPLPSPHLIQSTTLFPLNPRSPSPMPPLHLVPSPNTDRSNHSTDRICLSTPSPRDLRGSRPLLVDRLDVSHTQGFLRLLSTPLHPIPGLQSEKPAVVLDPTKQDMRDDELPLGIFLILGGDGET